jgi:hypothetical protein
MQSAGGGCVWCACVFTRVKCYGVMVYCYNCVINYNCVMVYNCVINYNCVIVL